MRLSYRDIFHITALLCGTVLSSVLLVGTPLPTHAATSPITVTTHSQTMHYPNSVDFSMTVSDTSSTITSAVLYMSIQVGGIYGGSIGGEQHTVTVQPAKTVNATYTEDLTGSSFVRPGTPINYYWVIQDSANNSYTDATQNFVVNDSRFSWQHLTRGLLRVYWYNQPKSFGQVILNHAATSLDRISHHLGVTPYSPINLWIYIDHADFTGAIGPNDGMKQSLRVDVAHLENQWHLFLNQPSTLGGSSSTASNKVTTPNPSAIATTLTVVSLVLVIGAFLAVLLVFVTMRQRRKKLYSESDTATETSHEDM